MSVKRKADLFKVKLFLIDVLIVFAERTFCWYVITLLLKDHLVGDPLIVRRSI